ncbi:ABC transporter substrate-binding protein [Loktanella salsilacus]|jgi:glycerol transport system substrate-binding protein|uniref:Carbohydrate ABC transporter substrate-binding protein, CUT1 family n=1 Tax=Loktanella salsilacus TaxID=195913 RepID=A0A1I4D5U3_9RHOB|nr:ABC transporter substrate-binding protein [Loktanella salsilacus]MBU0781152.1 ABC transporter substrate-binding protein [Alphaproteobacteria bacterium]MBU0862060.1 ABC transporter substrate-binding protein [Alphaproteobacteria bacterium]MBU1838144.1 ABC transporter substrate-binding protein [Alphaproteobacteria bacterium]UTH47632.1 carbohydrate ABC transporter substrate-binding protein [Loktanella salsilacus]SFK88189.1 carbohydrate ABC transporter substrate-binding protein, CUT1 family [Lok
MNVLLKSSTALGLALAMTQPAWADMAAATSFLDAEIGDVSTLSRADQEAEMQWFVDAAQPYQGMEINVVSETITTHEYEAQVLAPAFTAITGIKVTHDLIGEGDVVEKLQTQMQSGENIYDAYVNDSDLIGTHWRYQQVRNLTDWMANEGKDVTSPTLNLEDFIGTEFTTAPDGKLYQLPTQQFANLYWFRYDWFNDEQNKADFKETYGYDLGVPVNWSAYEDIAEFFTGRDLSRMGVEGEVFGNMDYGKKDPSLGWRYTDAWMSMAGMGDKGEPNGLPVDEWGIRVNENSQPTGACTTRGGATNSPAAVYAVDKAINWLQKYSPPSAMGMTFSEAGPIPGQGNIAQQMFWYTAFTAATVTPDLPVMNEDGTPKWRMAPSPHGAYWEEGMKVGYQDVGSWTLMESTPVDRAQAAWLYAQFVTSMTVDVKKSDVGLTFIRESTVNSEHFTERADKLGGLVEFYRSPARTQWSPTGTNVPDYPKLAQLWWQNIGDAMSGAKTSQEALDQLCADMESVMERIERSGIQGDLGPVMNDVQDAQYWLDQPGAPKPKLANEDEEPMTIGYDELVASWN